MKNLKKFKLLLLCPILIGLLIISCEKDDYFIDEQNNVNSEINDKSLQSKNEKFKGAKKLKNPYSVKNMNKALENIKKNLKEKKIKTKGTSASRLEQTINDLEFNTTYYYVKFTPQNTEEESLIKNDDDLHVFDYPLDYEFSDTYLDNRTPDNDSIPEYYTAVPVGKILPSGVASEIIENLYIPEEDPFFDTYEISSEPEAMTRQGEIGNNEDLLRHLLMEAFTLTGNEKELMPEGDTTNSWWIFGSKWYPSGKLKIWDDNAGSSTTTTQTFSHWEYYNCDTGEIVPAPDELLPYVKVENARIDPIDDNICQRAVYIYSTSTVQGKYVPLEGAQVLMRQWFTIRQGITDSNGNFNTGSVRGKARYVIQWERYHYSIRNGSLFQAETRGPKVKDEPWNKNIKGGDDEYHGMIHSAAHTYYYGNRFGLTSPPRNAFFKRQMKIAARESAPWGIPSSFSHLRSELTFGLSAQIHIKAYGRSSDNVYGTTIHELAHAAHWEVDSSSYNNLVRDSFLSGSSEVKNRNRRLLETWPTTVEIMLTVDRYRNKFSLTDYEYGNSDGFDLRNFQRKTVASENHYTSCGWDMLDNFNQGASIYSGGYGSSYPFDRVSGYTIKQLEDALVGARYWNEWRDNIKNDYSNPTSIYLDELFGNWTD
ncbi:hypothetical protein R3X25_14285 [Lutibacter sp. TH_r2]|uniref:hypothetical protein n=1 Tax=Lutibacter sp. TH_r2 TaxID=3082083 RepID=UPI002953DFBE|nr:hypothetical protein [Lutibacter sp. TH_r2]MDV7188457.1 hypothetical protein [Lutibacter sp. TH_r2]